MVLRNPAEARSPNPFQWLLLKLLRFLFESIKRRRINCEHYIYLPSGLCSAFEWLQQSSRKAFKFLENYFSETLHRLLEWPCLLRRSRAAEIFLPNDELPTKSAELSNSTLDLVDISGVARFSPSSLNWGQLQFDGLGQRHYVRQLRRYPTEKITASDQL